MPLRWRLLLAFALVVVVDFVPATLVVQIVPGIIGSSNGDESCPFPGLINPYCHDYNTLVYWLALIGLLLVIVASWVVATFLVLAPLRTMRGTVRQLGPQNLGQRVRMSGGWRDPLRQLSDEIDSVLDRVSVGYESQRSFAANASHELRTPLAVQRTLIEVAMEAPDGEYDLRQLGRNLLAANVRNERLIEGLLVLTEVDRVPIARQPVRFEQVVSAVLTTHAELAERRHVTLHSDLNEHTIPGDGILLERLVTNLVRNAILYNVEGGSVDISVGESPTLTIRNTGDHVPAESVPTLFEPFRRGTPDRVSGNAGGAGLGLSIVRAITQAHDGTVEATAQPTGGLNIAVTLPTY